MKNKYWCETKQKVYEAHFNIRVCPECEKEMAIHLRSKSPQMIKLAKQEFDGRYPEKFCLQCGKKISIRDSYGQLIHPSSYKTKKFCNRECSTKYSKREVTEIRQCKICGKDIPTEGRTPSSYKALTTCGSKACRTASMKQNGRSWRNYRF